MSKDDDLGIKRIDDDDANTTKKHSTHHKSRKITLSFTRTQLIIGLLVFGIVLVSSVLVISVLTGGFGFGSNDSAGAAVGAPQRVFVSADDDPILGDADAPLTIIEFSDYQCPYCKRFWDQTLPSVKSEYIETGKVKLVYRDLPLPIHPFAQKAAESAECAGDQGAYWKMHDAIFGASDISVDGLKSVAKGIVTDSGAFEECLDSGKYESEVKKDYVDGGKLGVRGTPSFFIGDDERGYVKLVGAQPFAIFQGVIDSELDAQN